MSSSWTRFWGHCKSRLSAIGRECFLGRDKWREKVRQLRTVIKGLRSRASRQTLEIQKLEEDVKELRRQLAEYRPNRVVQSVKLQKPEGCQYTADRITLAVNLARAIGLRPATNAMRIMFKWLKREEDVPTYQTIRTWMQRIGLDRTENAKKVEHAVWLVDHTCQTGKEKVLTILRVRSTNGLTVQGPLKLADLEPLAEVTRKSWHQADVLEVYKATCEKYGAPRAILADQASELQESAKALKSTHKDVISLVDFKHFMANRFKSILTDDPEYATFTEKLKHSCASVQQTALSHFVPRPIKRKARFMNIGPILHWAKTVLWHLEHPGSRACADVPPGQVTEKFGWLQDLKPSIAKWQQCQEIIDAGVQLVNKQGLSHSTAEEFRQLAKPLARCPAARKLVKSTIAFLQAQASQLQQDERLPMSTEVLESLYARYKAIEKQHSKEGFSGLLLAIGTLLRPVTDKEVIRSFKRTKCKQVQEWIRSNLGRTYTSKRQDFFRECTTAVRSSKKSATVIVT